MRYATIMQMFQNIDNNEQYLDKYPFMNESSLVLFKDIEGSSKIVQWLTRWHIST